MCLTVRLVITVIVHLNASTEPDIGHFWHLLTLNQFEILQGVMPINSPYSRLVISKIWLLCSDSAAAVQSRHFQFAIVASIVSIDVIIKKKEKPRWGRWVTNVIFVWLNTVQPGNTDDCVKPGLYFILYCKKINKYIDFCQIMCRCSTPLETAVKEKISMFCHVEPTQVRYMVIFSTTKKQPCCHTLRLQLWHCLVRISRTSAK